MDKSIIVVLGMHRSGTSAVAKSIVELGAHPGNNLMPKNEDNPRGYWEDTNIVSLNEAILKKFNMRWDTIDNPMINRFENFLELYGYDYLEEAIEIVRNNLRLTNTLMIKDPRISILLPFWQKVFTSVGVTVKYILALRNPLETAKSLLKRNNLSLEQGLRLWSYYNFMVCMNLRSQLLICEFNSLLNNQISELARISKYIDSKTSDLKQSNDFLDKSLKHYNDEEEDLIEHLGFDHILGKFYHSLLESSKKENSIRETELYNVSEAFREAMIKFLGFSNKYIDNYAQLFLYNNQTFYEKNSLKYRLQTIHNTIDLHISDGNTINKIRFDPFTDRCILILHKIDDYPGEIKGNYLYSYKNFYLFEDDDPQLFFTFSNHKITEIHMVFSVFTIDIYTYAWLCKEKVKLVKKEITDKYEGSIKDFLYLMNKRDESKNFTIRGYLFKKIKNMIKSMFSFHKSGSLRKSKRIIKDLGFFDKYYYLYHNRDVILANSDPLEHYIKSGWREGRIPAENFDTNDFLAKYAYLLSNDSRSTVKQTNTVMDRIPAYSSEDSVFKKLINYKISRNKSMVQVIKFILDNGLVEFYKKMHLILYPKGYEYNEPKIDKPVESDLLSFTKKPLITIILSEYNVNLDKLQSTFNSVLNQWYTKWELYVIHNCSTNTATLNYLRSQTEDHRIKVIFNDGNMSFLENCIKILEVAAGEYITVLTSSYELSADAFYEVVKEINASGADFIYSDHDRVNQDGRYSHPHYKPDFSPDMILSQNYIGDFAVIKKDIVNNVGGLTNMRDEAWAYDLYLRVFDYTNHIKHVPKVLYHQRSESAPQDIDYCNKNYLKYEKQSLIDTIIRRDLTAQVLDGKFPGTFRVKYEISGNPLVSIIIPFKDKPELLRVCIESIIHKSTYNNYEIIGISNNSNEQETFTEMSRLTFLDSRIRFEEYNTSFNYSKINNYAVKELAEGEHIILLNNDTEIITPDWIECLLEFSQRENVGTVGAKLLYPNNTIQHAGVIMGLGVVAGHSHRFIAAEDPGYFFRPHIIQNLSAVTAACLMVKRSLYLLVNGLNESDLKIAYNDVDFCLRLRGLGYFNVYTPYAELYHFESVSRGHESPETVTRYRSEIEYMQHKYSQIIKGGDPYYNPNLTCVYEDFSLKQLSLTREK